MKTIVVYRTKYGSSKQYATWIAEALQCEARDGKDTPLQDILAHDVIIYVGGLYASRVKGFKKISKHWDALQGKQIILCMVGMTNPIEKDGYQRAFEYNVYKPYRKQVKYFALRGNQLFSQMGLLHRLMMKVPKSITQKIPVEKRTEDDVHFLEHFGEDVHHINQDYIHDVVAYAKGLG